MRINSHKLTSLVVVLVVSTTTDAAGSALTAARHFSAATAVGQADPRRSAVRDSRQEVEELMRRARQAMESGHLETADSLVSRAEALSVRFNLIDGLLRDTPKKVRRDLQRLDKRTPRSRRPSELSKPAMTLDVRKDTIAAKNGIIKNPFVEAEASREPTSLLDEKSKAKRYLVKGRQELSRGNIAGAKSWYIKAAQFGAEFDPHEDSPERLAEDIRRSGGEIGDLAGPAAAARSDAASAILTPDMVDEGSLGPLMGDRRAAAFAEPGRGASAMESPFGGRPIDAPPAAESLHAPGSPQAVGGTGDGQLDSRRQQSDSLLLEARRALAAGDIRQASQLTAHARQLGVRYGLHDDTPERVEALVQKAGELIRSGGREGSPTEAYRLQLAGLLMQQSEGLLAWGALDDAERMARQAAKINVNYGPFDANPQKLLERIASRRQAANPQSQNVDQTVQPVEGSFGVPQLADAEAQNRRQVAELLDHAKTAVAQGDLERADQLTRQAESISRADAPQAAPTRAARPAEPAFAGLAAPASESSGLRPLNERAGAPVDIRNALQRPNQNTSGSEAVAVSALPSAAIPPVGQTPSHQVTQAMVLVERGQQALREGNVAVAQAMFQQAVQRGDELDPQTRQRVENHLKKITPDGAPSSFERRAEAIAAPSPLLSETTTEQDLRARQLSAEIARRQHQASQLLEEHPKQAFEILKESRSMIELSGLDTAARQALLRRVHRAMAELEQYVTENRARIELDDRNRDVLEQIEYERQQKQEVDQKLARLVEEYNQRMDEQRFAEAQLVARKVEAIVPDNPLSQTLKHQSRNAMRLANQLDLADMKEDEFVTLMESLERSSAPLDDGRPIRFPVRPVWEDLTKRRLHLSGDAPRVRNAWELEIEKTLQKKVRCQFQNAPLSEVIDRLDELTGANLHIDLQGLAEEGVATDEPISLDLSEEISLKSALNLILQPLHLGYVIGDEVLKITSEQVTEGDIRHETYNVVDLVLPIPNFGPNRQVGMAATLHDAYMNHPLGGTPGMGAAPWMMAGGDQPFESSAVNPEVLAQVHPTDAFAGMSPGRGAQILGPGPGGMGGGANADFDTLINLITTTIEPDSWRDAGGTGDIESYPSTFSLVISTTEDTHRQIRELLEQLRRLQDLQVTIEVRFITLNDNFFERIGIDFDFDVDDDIDRPFQVFGQPDPAFQGQFNNSGAVPGRDLQDRDHGPSVTAGLTAPGIFSADLDIPFRQGSFDLAVPQFGGFDPGAGASIGFAILSDLEAFFFLSAAQGDRRSNVLQAPKVTLFNGQQASVFDVSQSPFVISVIPVVGDFAAAQAPVIAILNEGTAMTVQAAVSPDRRFVRLTLVPYFSTISDRNRTFTFTGSSTTTTNSSSEGPDDATTARDSDSTTTTEGTTVQLPTVAFITVATTVSVPDGGSVLLGGIKRLSEGRNEFGVPFLSKLPYINRLFTNVSIGRETQSLMMMVTPRIIIQEEEEDNLLRTEGGP